MDLRVVEIMGTNFVRVEAKIVEANLPILNSEEIGDLTTGN